MGAMNSLNLAMTAASTSRMANARPVEPPWVRQWSVDLYTTDDGKVRARARVGELRTETTVTRFPVGWRVGQVWEPFTPPKGVLKAAARLVRKNLS